MFRLLIVPLICCFLVAPASAYAAPEGQTCTTRLVREMEDIKMTMNAVDPEKSMTVGCFAMVAAAIGAAVYVRLRTSLPLGFKDSLELFSIFGAPGICLAGGLAGIYTQEALTPQSRQLGERRAKLSLLSEAEKVLSGEANSGKLLEHFLRSKNPEFKDMNEMDQRVALIDYARSIHNSNIQGNCDI